MAKYGYPSQKLNPEKIDPVLPFIQATILVVGVNCVGKNCLILLRNKWGKKYRIVLASKWENR